MQITIEKIKEFVKSYMSDTTFLPSQRAVSGPRIQILYDELVNDIVHDPIKVSDNMIIDGHHRYIAGMILGKTPNSVPWTPSPSHEKGIWKSMKVEDELWDY